MAKLSDEQVKQVIGKITAAEYVELIQEMNEMGLVEDPSLVVYDIDDFNWYFEGTSPYRMAALVRYGLDCGETGFDVARPYFRVDWNGTLQGMDEDYVVKWMVNAEAYSCLFDTIQAADDLPKSLARLLEKAGVPLGLTA